MVTYLFQNTFTKVPNIRVHAHTNMSCVQYQFLRLYYYMDYVLIHDSDKGVNTCANNRPFSTMTSLGDKIRNKAL